jgi:hypothetical protein
VRARARAPRRVKDCDDCSPTQRQLGKNALGLLTVAAIALISAFAAAFSAGKESQVACGPSELISAQAQLVSALRESLHTQKRLVTMEEEVRESERAATEAQECACCPGARETAAAAAAAAATATLARPCTPTHPRRRYAQSLEEEMEEREEESRKEYREREAAPAAGGRAGGSAQAAA